MLGVQELDGGEYGAFGGDFARRSGKKNATTPLEKSIADGGEALKSAAGCPIGADTATAVLM